VGGGDVSLAGRLRGIWPVGNTGWWQIAPSGTAFPLRANNRYAGYYAESASGKIWSGDRGPVYVYQQAFFSTTPLRLWSVTST
jgi:hypothetical protein